MKHLFFMIALVLTFTGAIANSTPSEHPIKIEVINKETKAVTFVREFKNLIEANETLNIYVIKDGFKFKQEILKDGISKKIYETDSGDIITLQINNNLSIPAGLQEISKERAKELGITQSATKICSEWKNCCRTCHDGPLYYVECSDDRGCPNN